jgi:hypothetical protein
LNFSAEGGQEAAALIGSDGCAPVPALVRRRTGDAPWPVGGVGALPGGLDVVAGPACGTSRRGGDVSGPSLEATAGALDRSSPARFQSSRRASPVPFLLCLPARLRADELLPVAQRAALGEPATGGRPLILPSSPPRPAEGGRTVAGGAASRSGRASHRRASPPLFFFFLCLPARLRADDPCRWRSNPPSTPRPKHRTEEPCSGTIEPPLFMGKCRFRKLDTCALGIRMVNCT